MTERRWLAPFLAGLAARLAFPWYSHGFHQMDEHWQAIEPANHLVHGPWSITWEWAHGGRSWIYPWLVSLPMRAAELLGLHDPIQVVAFVRSAHGLVSATAIPIVYLCVDKLAVDKQAKRGSTRGRAWPLLAAWMLALWPYAIYAGTRTHSDMASAMLVLLAFAAPLFIVSETRSSLASGAAFGAALALKIDVAVAGLGYGLRRLATGRFRAAIFLVAGVAPFVVLLGAIDRLSWGGWFSSVTSHARWNLVEEVGNQWGVSPWYMHVVTFFDIGGAPTLAAALALPFVWRWLPRPLRDGWVMAAIFVAVFAYVPHKEKRFIAPLLDVELVLAFSTLAYAWARIPRRGRAARWIAGILIVATATHATANVVTYLVRRPWWDRIQAMRQAGEIPGIEKMFSPEWPAVFYLPRNVSSECIDADPTTLAAKTRGLRDIGLALDWRDLSPLTRLGFRCETWPRGTPAPTEADPIPRAFHCLR